MHDLAAARATGFLGALHAAAALLGLPALADKGYPGAGIGIHTPAKGAHLAPSTSTRNRLLTGCAPKANRASPCSRPGGKRYATSGCARSGSVRSPLRLWS